MRRTVSVIVVIFLLLGGFILPISFDLTSQDASAEDWYMSIDVDTTWNTDMAIKQDIYISAGKTLTIDPGVTILFDGAFSLIVNSTGKLVANGGQTQPITFDRTGGSKWAGLEVLNNARSELDWCTFNNANNGIILQNNQFYTNITNSSFSNCIQYLNIKTSKVNITSTKFEGKAFDKNPNQILGKIDMDSTSEIYIQYFVNIYTVNGSSDLTMRARMTYPVSNVNVDLDNFVQDRLFGTTGSNGTVSNMRATSLKINGSAKTRDYQFSIYKMEVSDKWDSTMREAFGISRNSTNFNLSSIVNQSFSGDDLEVDSNLHINAFFMFKYPPVITSASNRVTVYEDAPKTDSFIFFDNDDDSDLESNITINITDQHGKTIYSDEPNTTDTWISWYNETEELIFYRTIESPDTPAGPGDYKAKVDETIYVTITDLLGQKAEHSIIIEYHNVPDKPMITGIPVTIPVVEDQVKYIPISVSDNDNGTADIYISSNSEYVKYVYNDTNDQSLYFKFPNEFGADGSQQLVNISATDNCSDEVTYNFNVLFSQTPDRPKIIGTIPNKIGTETDWTPELVLNDYWFDPDPDDNANTLDWYVSGVNAKYFEVFGANQTAVSPLSFNYIYDIDLGGARSQGQIVDDVTIWLEDKDGLKVHQNIKLIVTGTNQQPSLHKVKINNTQFSVQPEAGDNDQTYKFMIEYKDRDGLKGDAPEHVRVIIDSEQHDMLEQNPDDEDHIDGKLYYYETKLSIGTHQHYFVCSDSALSSRQPKLDDDPNIISLPVVSSKINIGKFKSNDGNFIAKIAYTGNKGSASITITATDVVSVPAAAYEERKGDIGVYFVIKTQNMSSIIWVDISVKFGSGFDNYGSRWLKKDDMDLAYLENTTWQPLIQESNMFLEDDMNMLGCNFTRTNILSALLIDNNTAMFTVIGWLDADSDGYFNDEDDFPFDTAASEDRDTDGSPDKWNPGKNQKDSTTEPKLHLDKFPDDPAASLDDDEDGYPDAWNPGMGYNDSTSDPKLNLDIWPGDPEMSLDTDRDGYADGDKLNTKPWMDRDDDNDGMPDAWEIKWLEYAIEHNISYHFNPKDRTDGAYDWDSDGRNNTKEYLENTNPFKKDTPKKDEGMLSGSAGWAAVIAMVVIIVILILFMYTKMHRDQLLEHKVRAKILDYINGHPGTHYRKILSELDMQMGTLTHHLNMLERQKYIKSLQDSMYRRFYPVGTPIKTGLLLTEVQERILGTMKKSPGMSQAEIARRLNVARKVVNYHMKILSDADFARVELVGRASRCYYLDGLEFPKKPKPTMLRGRRAA